MSGFWKEGGAKEAVITEVGSPYASDAELCLSDGEDDKQRAHRREAANRSMVVKTRVSLLFMISVAIVGTSVVTWHVSLTTTSEAFDDMSNVLRHEVITGSAAKVRDFIDSLAMGYTSVFECLESLNDFSRPAMSTSVMTCMWSTVTAASNARGTHVITRDHLMSSYRRYGPEARMLNVTMVATVPSPPEDKEAIMYVYIPDEDTGEPLTDGPFLKACERGHCPASPDPEVYMPPLPLLTEFPTWVAAQNLEHKEHYLGVSIGVAGSWLPIVFMVGAFRDPASDDLVAVMAMIYQATTIREHLESLLVVSEMGGVMFVTTGSALNILSATRGDLIILPTEEIPYAAFVRAADSNDPIVSAASRYMSDNFGSMLFAGSQEARIAVPGVGNYYINSQAITHHGLTLLAFLAVPTDVFRGHIDDARRTSVRVTIFVVLVIFLGGVVGILASTLQLTNTFSIVANQNEILRLKLRHKDREGDDGSWSNVDMGTANEKLHAMIRMLQAGRPLTQQQVAQMQELINADDMHKPQFLRTMQNDKDSTVGVLDHETGSWLFSLTNAGAPKKRPSGLAHLATRIRGRGQRTSFDSPVWSDMDTSSQGSHPPGQDPASWVALDFAASDAEVTQSLHDVEVACSQLVDHRASCRMLERRHSDAAARKAPPILAKLELGSHINKCPVAECEQVLVPGPLAEQLAKLGSWEMDTIALAKASAQRPILFVGFCALHASGLIRTYHLPKDRLVRFLLELEEGMAPDAFYHSAAHIADVTGSLYHLLLESGVSQHLRRIDELAALCAALMHDYKHPGVNNDFIQRTGGELALRYNDHSILENFHLSEAFTVLRNDACNFLKPLGTTSFAELRHIAIEMVLATDLKRHFALLDAFKSRLLNLTDKPWDKESESDRLLLLRMAIKIADLGHTCKSLPLHKVWTGLIVEEFYAQGDAERAADLTISPFMDRHNNCVPKAQHGFFHFVVLPLVEAWVKAFPKSAPLLANLVSNCEYWKVEQRKLQVDEPPSA